MNGIEEFCRNVNFPRGEGRQTHFTILPPAPPPTPPRPVDLFCFVRISITDSACRLRLTARKVRRVVVGKLEETVRWRPQPQVIPLLAYGYFLTLDQRYLHKKIIISSKEKTNLYQHQNSQNSNVSGFFEFRF